MAGCSTTQQEAARLQLNDARIRASQDSTRVAAGARMSAIVTPGAITLLRTAAGTAFVVLVHNSGREPVSDLPVSAGYRDRGRVVYLNAAAGADYFETHLPPIGAHRSIAWVYRTERSLPASARPFVRIGARRAADPGELATPPAIGASALRLSGDRLTVALRNRTAIPQYQLPVYATARRRGRYVAAGAATVAHLGSGAAQTLHVTLVGTVGSARLVIEAPPTIFR